MANCLALAILLRVDWENRQLMRGAKLQEPQPTFITLGFAAGRLGAAIERSPAGTNPPLMRRAGHDSPPLA